MITTLLNRFNRHAADDLLSAFVDRELGEAAARRLEAHLDACAECRARLDGLRATVSLLRAVATARAPRSFALQEAPQQSKAFAARFGWLAAPGSWVPALAATAAAAVFGLLLIGNLTGGLEQSGASPVARVVSTVPVERKLAREAAAPAEAAAQGARDRGVEVTVVVKEAAVEREPAVEAKALAPEASRTLAAPPEPVEKPVAAEAMKRPVETATATPPTALMEAAVAEKSAAEAPAAGAETRAQARVAAGTPTVAETLAPGEAAAPSPAPQRELARGDEAATEALAVTEIGQPGEAVTPSPAPQREFARVSETRPAGRALPLWQLEIASGALAVVLGLAAWVLRRRRGRAF